MEGKALLGRNLSAGDGPKLAVAAFGLSLPVLAAILESEAYMAVLDWSQCPAVESNPEKLGGAWVLRGTRMPVASIFENIEDGLSIAEVMEQFDVTRDEIRSVLEFAARSLDVPLPIPPSRPADARSL